ncbi:MAG: hypothetical protein WC349_01395 [Patescibacteria group bacterium]|jgi:acyl carrier protein
MEDNDILQEVKRIIGEAMHGDVAQEDITLESQIGYSLGAEFFDAENIIAGVERKFLICIDVKKLNGIGWDNWESITVKSLVDAIKEGG